MLNSCCFSAFAAVVVCFSLTFHFLLFLSCPFPTTQIMPIYELVRFSTAAGDVGARLANLQRGYDEYMQQFDSCRCAPCRHSGVQVLTGTSCSCLCKSGYQGEACEETLRTGETVVIDE